MKYAVILAVFAAAPLSESFGAATTYPDAATCMMVHYSGQPVQNRHSFSRDELVTFTAQGSHNIGQGAATHDDWITTAHACQQLMCKETNGTASGCQPHPKTGAGSAPPH